MSYSVGIFIFDNVEVLDFAGPYEVFTTASRVYKKLHMSSIEIPFEAFTIGKRKEPIHARAGLKIDPDLTLYLIQKLMFYSFQVVLLQKNSKMLL